MLAVIGLVVLLVMVFGGFALTGGNIMVILEALPHEMLIIGGAARRRDADFARHQGHQGDRRRVRQDRAVARATSGPTTMRRSS